MKRIAKGLVFVKLLGVGISPLVPASLAAQAAAPPMEVVLIGTVHEPTAAFREETLAGILEKLQPEVILLELDRSFFDNAMTLLPRWERVSLESRAAIAYGKSRTVALLPFDIDGRNSFYQNNDYFAREMKLNQELSRLYSAGELTPESRATLEALRGFAAVRDACGQSTPAIINSAPCDVAVERKQFYAFKGFTRIIASTPALADMATFSTLADDFWTRRNDQMVRNILQHLKERHPRRLVVLAGFEHRYYLKRRLADAAKSEGFVLREYSGY